MNQASKRSYGYVCPVHGCPKKHNRRFALYGLMYHLLIKHKAWLIKKLNIKQDKR